MNLLISILFVGNITGTAVSGSPSFELWYEPGDVWISQYSYESDSIDGRFFPTLIPIEGKAPYATNGTLMDVENGEVTSFFLQSLNSPYWISMNGWIFDKFGGGSVEISDPISVSSQSIIQVHEPSILALSLFGLFLMRRIRG